MAEMHQFIWSKYDEMSMKRNQLSKRKYKKKFEEEKNNMVKEINAQNLV